MVAMASDSYLLKVPQPPCQRCKTPARSTSCGVVVSLVFLAGAVVTLGVCGYLMMVQLCVARSELQSLKTKVEKVQTVVNRYNWYVQMKQFEIQSEETTFPDPYSDEEEDEEEEDDDMEPTYPDADYEVPFENKVRDPAQDSPSNVPLEPAGSLRMSGLTTTADTTPAPSVEPTSAYPEEENFNFQEYDPEEDAVGRSRRDVGARRPDPQLKLYHMLQTPGVVPRPAVVEPWGYHDSYRAAPQPMYAEHAPMAFVPPPRPQGSQPSTPMSPVLNRRSRVMDDTFTVSTPAPARHHRRRTGRRQRLQQQQQYPLQDVTQDVMTERSVEVGPQRYAGHGRRYEQQVHEQPQASHGGPYPWRGARVTDTFQH